MNKNSYTSIHNHTDYSNLRLIDSINTVKTLIDRAVELKLNGVAITDHESVSGHLTALKYYKEVKKDNPDFKLILGNEIYLTREGLNAENHQKGESFYHMILLAKDNIGHEQIRELSSRASQRGYVKNLMRAPTYPSDLEDVIGNNPGHVITTTACLGSFAGRHFANGELERIEAHFILLERIFGKENFFIEIQPHIFYPEKSLEEQNLQIRYNFYLIKNFWEKYNFVYSTDSHYLSEDEREIHKEFLQSKSGEREVDEFYMYSYVMGYEEIYNMFSSYISEEKIRTMTDNTNYINSQVGEYDLTFPQIVPKIKYEPERFSDKIELVREMFLSAITEEKEKYLYYFLTTENHADKYLMDLILEGYYNKIYFLSSPVSLQERIERLDYELEQIYETSIKIDQSLSDYFITMAKMIEIIWDEAESIVGPGRGSASGFLIDYLIGITQIDPLDQALYMPPWRFIHKDRPGLPDIDIDTESTKRLKIFNKIQQYFNSIGSFVVNVCTFGTEGSKSSIRTAARSLGIDDDVVNYLTSLIPNERGNDLTLSQCYDGDETHKPIKEFVNEMNRLPKLKKLAFRIEGLITRLGAHAAGILILTGNASKHNAIMKTSKGIVVSAFDLHDSEEMGGLKYDLLTVQALDKIHATLNYLLEDGLIEWQGTLRDTYNKYLLPANIDYDNPEMWEMLGRGEIIDVFQFDTPVGSQAVKTIKPKNLKELAIANSIMRLMAQEGGESPLNTFVRFKENIAEWYREMTLYGLTKEEIEILEPYLKPLFGVADSQESVMQIVMDKKISNFTLNDANYLRKAIAKKDPEVLEKTRKLYFEKGSEIGTSYQLLNYVWSVQIGRQIGYSFSLLHTMAYSTIALQEMNLAFYYPAIYWKTACLSVNAGAVNEEDYYNLVEEGVLELSDEEDVRTQNKIQYGKIATAISNMRDQIDILLPDINKSRLGFTPDSEKNSILYGIKGISRVGESIIQEIILNRPYTSLRDFENKLNSTKKTVSKDRVINLIKAGCFDRIENKDRKEILKDYIRMIADKKNNLTLQNFLMLIRKNLVPERFNEEVKIFNFTKYLRKNRYENYYLLDEVALDFFLEKFDKTKLLEIETNLDSYLAIGSSWWDSIYNSYMQKIRDWLAKEKEELLEKLNNVLFQEEFEKYAKGDILDWELSSLSFFYSGHPLTNLELPIEISDINDIKENEVIGQFRIQNKTFPKFRLHTIIGTIIDKDKVRSIVTLATPSGVIDVKMYKQQYALYSHASDLDENDENYIQNEENFIEKGTHLAITGIKRGDVFIPKVYKNTGFPAIMKIKLDDNRKFVNFLTK